MAEKTTERSPEGKKEEASEKPIESKPKVKTEKKEKAQLKEAEKEEKTPQKETEEQEKQTSLVETDKYLNTGAHIGTKFKSGDMKRYIYKVRKDGLNVLDVQTLDERLKLASHFIAGYDPERIVVVSRKVYGQTPAKVFAESIGAKILTGRFIPGTFTNPQSNRFIEPNLVIVTDPEADSQAIKEATIVRVPVVGLASTNNSLRNIDVAIPINNKGKKSLALGYWIIAKEVLKERGDIKDDKAFSKTPEDFEYKMKEGEEEEKKAMGRKSKWKSFSRNGPGGAQQQGGPPGRRNRRR